jgi:hypothetical protein
VNIQAVVIGADCVFASLPFALSRFRHVLLPAPLASRSGFPCLI